MEKSTYNNNSHPYPQMPAEMNASSSFSGHHAMPAPPSYEQATHAGNVSGGGGYPPVQVLPTPNVNSLNRSPQQMPQQQQQMPQNTQVFVGGVPNAQYVGVSVGTGGGGSGRSVPPQTSYPRQQQGAPQPMLQQPPVVIVQQQAAVPLGPEPTYVLCPFCHIQKMTRTVHEPNAKTHLMAAILCFLGLWCCACFPYCAESCMNTNHYCGNCNKFLGTYAGSL